MRCGSDKEKDYGDKKNNRRFTRPSDKGLKMPSHPSSDIKEQKQSPRGNTQEAKHIENQRLIAYSRRAKAVVISGIEEGGDCDGNSQNRGPDLTCPFNQDIKDKKLK